MRVYKITAADYVVGIVVDQKGDLDSSSALQEWNAQAGNYQGDTATDTRFIIHD